MIKRYLRPETFDELWTALDEAGSSARLCAGCTDLIPKKRAGVVPEGVWIDIRRIPALSGIEKTGATLSLGSCVTHHQVATSQTVSKEAPALAQACGSVGSRQIRALGTLGGNAANASPCADSALALVAVDAQVVIRSPKGSRKVPMSGLATGVGETCLEWGEVIERFEVPLSGARSVFAKLGPRKAHAVAKVSVAASARLASAGTIEDLKLVMGSVAPTQIRVPEAERAAQGQLVNEALLATIGEHVTAAISPIDDVRSTAAYRKRTASVLALRALRGLVS